MEIKVLVVDDEEGEVIQGELIAYSDERGTRFATQVARSACGAIDILREMEFDVAVVDMVMPDLIVPASEAGLRVIKAIRDGVLNTEAIVLTGHASNANTVRAMEEGAFSYVEKGSEAWSILPLKIRLAAERKYARKACEDAERARIVAGAIEEIVHDMGNTLMPVLGFAELAASRSQAAAAELQSCLNDVLSGAERLKGMREDILSVGSNASMSLNSVFLDLAEELRQREPFFREICRLRSCEFRLELTCSGESLLDGPRVLRAIENLIGNAARAVAERWGTDAGGNVEVTLREQGSRLYVEVSDNGVGMDAEVCQKLFQPGGDGRHIRGYGIGLQAAKRSIELHGGTLKVQSQPGVGSTFSVELPVMRRG